jgi:hypothetical protein
MAGLLDIPQLPGLLPMPSWDDFAQRVPPGVGNPPFWHLPFVPPTAAPAPMMYPSLPSGAPVVSPPQPFAGPPVMNWTPPPTPPAAPDNTAVACATQWCPACGHIACLGPGRGAQAD